MFVILFNPHNNSLQLCFIIPVTQLKNLRFRDALEIAQSVELDDQDGRPGILIHVCVFFFLRDTASKKGKPVSGETELLWVTMACFVDSEEFGPVLEITAR